MRQTQAEVRRIAGTSSDVERTVVSNFRRMSEGVSGLQVIAARARTAFVAFQGALAGVGLATTIRQSTQLADSIGDMAEQTGVSIEALQRLRFAAAQSGASAELMDRALNVLNERLGEAAAGSTDAQQKFADLGLRWQDLRQAGTEDAFLTIADAISQIPDVTDRASRQAGIFGERSRALTNTLLLGRDGLIAFGQAAQRTGVILDEQSVRTLAAANDQLDTFVTQLQVAAARAVVQLTPLINDLGQSINRIAGALVSANVEWANLTNLEAAVVRFFQNVSGVIGELLPRIQSTITDINNLIGLFGRVQEFLQSLSVTGPGTRTGRIAEIQQTLELLSRRPSSAIDEANRARLQAELTRLQAQQIETARPFAGPGIEGAEARELGLRRRPPPPFTVPGGGRGGRGGGGRPEKTILDQLTQEAREAEGVFRTFEAAITSIEQEIRTLEPATPIIQDLDEAAARASVSFRSWQEAIQSIEEDIRSSVDTAGNYGDAIERANERIREAVTASRDALAGQAEALNEQYQTPIERLREFRDELIETQGLLDRGVAPRALRDAQIAYARTTLAGQGLVLVAEGITEAFDQSFQGIIQGTLSVGEAFRNLAQSILLSISKLLLQRGIETLLGVALSGLGAGAAGGAGGAAVGGAGGFQQGGFVPGRRGAGDIVPAFLTPGEFVLRRQAVDAIGVDMLAKINALRFQQGGPVIPQVAGLAPTQPSSPGITVNNIVVRSDSEAEAKRQELQALDGHIVNVINRQILGGDGSLINRSLSMVRGGR